jgi:hypothetical protein
MCEEIHARERHQIGYALTKGGDSCIWRNNRIWISADQIRVITAFVEGPPEIFILRFYLKAFKNYWSCQQSLKIPAIVLVRRA